MGGSQAALGNFLPNAPSKPFQFACGYRNFFISNVKNYTAVKKSSDREGVKD